MVESALGGNDEGGTVVIDKSQEQPPLTATPEELKKFLLVIQKDVLPKTRSGVENGNKVFGAAVLNPDLSVSYADTNEETTCPLFHGEVKVIYEWSKQTAASERGPLAQKSVFLATHEPCCMCISSIVWGGFNKVFYFYPYSSTSAQGIPHDVNTMHELWGVASYRKVNKYCSTACIMDLIELLPDGTDEKKELQGLAAAINDEYEELSQKYHTEKANNVNNSLVLG
mmetsp:Transcript_18993/g.24459  ORF Transcript_18993/g.24459 Transcript_18993/m.24459 type:complete len:227 (-) Transcript_18993:167-847(-)|eukprot:CAMPEP_0198138798 /NCGR_PEP_ID=MMETSP1443-20131203/2191_1 /TAXON_ID=186043 /ORGANISM="Entomoneis sp., Strain CCMP2396" /LENGTH=226 /DNA_ID=CAMNT_0043800731 /DNA_START=107 /DNA_END=787 /DNA_ORIENTATION=-